MNLAKHIFSFRPSRGDRSPFRKRVHLSPFIPRGFFCLKKFHCFGDKATGTGQSEECIAGRNVHANCGLNNNSVERQKIVTAGKTALLNWVSHLIFPRIRKEISISISKKFEGLPNYSKNSNLYQQHQYPKVIALTSGCQLLTLNCQTANRDMLACLESGKVFSLFNREFRLAVSWCTLN